MSAPVPRWWLMTTFLVCVGIGLAQMPSPRPPGTNTGPGPGAGAPPPTAPSPDTSSSRGGRGSSVITVAQDDPQARQSQERQAELHKRLQQDATQLVVLARQLQDTINHNDPSVLSLEVVRQANAIDKLARKISDNMKNGTY